MEGKLSWRTCKASSSSIARRHFTLAHQAMLSCFHSGVQMAKFTEKLHKLSSGDLAAAAAMSTRKLSKAEQKDKDEDEGLEEDLGDGIGEGAVDAADMDWSPDSSQIRAEEPSRRMWRSRSRPPPSRWPLHQFALLHQLSLPWQLLCFHAR